MRIVLILLVCFFVSTSAFALPKYILDLPVDTWGQISQQSVAMDHPEKLIEAISKQEQKYDSAKLLPEPQLDYSLPKGDRFKSAKELLKPSRPLTVGVTTKLSVNSAQAVDLLVLGDYLLENKVSLDDTAMLLVYGTEAVNNEVPFEEIKYLIKQEVKNGRAPIFIKDDIKRLMHRYTDRFNDQ